MTLIDPASLSDDPRQIIDLAILAQLQADVSKEAFPELLAIFLAQGEERVASIEQAITEGNFANLANEVHSFKSESGTFGAIPLAELTTQINTLCNQGEKDQAMVAAQAIKAKWQMVRKSLQADSLFLNLLAR